MSSEIDLKLKMQEIKYYNILLSLKNTLMNQILTVSKIIYYNGIINFYLLIHDVIAIDQTI